MIEFKEIIEKLYDVSDKSWGIYAFRKEIIKNKISIDEVDILVNKAIVCGSDIALKMHKNNIYSINQIIKEFKLNLLYKDEYKDATDRLILALYNNPKKIVILKDPINRLVVNLNENKIYSLNYQLIENILIAHEIFHYYENKNKKIFTKTSLKYNKNILSEIAASSFTKEFLKLEFNPLMLDILFYYSYNKNTALSLYLDVIKIC